MFNHISYIYVTKDYSCALLLYTEMIYYISLSSSISECSCYDPNLTLGKYLEIFLAYRRIINDIHFQLVVNLIGSIGNQRINYEETDTFLELEIKDESKW